MTEQALDPRQLQGAADPRGPRPEEAGGRGRGDRYVESDTRSWQRCSAGGRRQAEHPRPERRGAPRLPHPSGEPTADDEPRRSTRRRRGVLQRVDGLDRRPRPHPQAIAASTSASTSRRRRTTSRRAGEDTNRAFPWVVSDFGLTDAIESGLVKIPQLAVATRPARSRPPTSTSGAGS